MRLLLDTCVPSATYQAILREGHDVDWVRLWSRDPGAREILRVAHETARVIVTLDKDFGELAVFEELPHSGIVLLRKLRIREQAARCLTALRRHAKELQQGAIVTVGAEKIRCRQP